MKIGPKYKICKRLGGGIFEKCQTQKFQLSEARRSSGRPKFRRQMSDYGRQLIEKQKVRFSYGITEKQLRRYVDIATKTDNPTDTLNKGLETRLDNVVYRSGLSKTRRAARQMVSHGHITVNGRKLTIPSYIMKVGDKFTVRDGSRSSVLFTEIAEQLKDSTAPKWISFNEKKLEGEIKDMPKYETGADIFDYPAVFEFYSR